MSKTIKLNTNDIAFIINESVKAAINERGGWSSFDSFEAAEQRKKAKELKQAMLTKKAASLGAEEKAVVKKKKKKGMPSLVGVKAEDSTDNIIMDLKKRFLLNGKEGSVDDSEKRMQQFLRYTDMELSKKNIAGGAIFTDANRSKNAEEWGRVYDLVHEIRVPAMNIAWTLKNVKKLDNDHILTIKNQLLDLHEALPVAGQILHEPAVVEAIKSGVPFWVGGNEMAGGHNVGFKDVLKQFIKDVKRGTYEQFAERLDDFVSKGKDPMSYKLSEAAFRNTVYEMVKKKLDEAEAFDDGMYDLYFKLDDVPYPDTFVTKLESSINSEADLQDYIEIEIVKDGYEYKISNLTQDDYDELCDYLSGYDEIIVED